MLGMLLDDNPPNLLCGIDIDDANLVFFYTMDALSGTDSPDSGPNSNDGTIVSSYNEEDPGVKGPSTKTIEVFSGSHIDAGLVSPNQNFSAMAWVMPHNLGQQFIFNDYDSGGNANSTRLAIGIAGSSTYEIVYGNGTAFYYNNGTYNHDFEADRWNHVAITNDGTNIRIYESGALVHTIAHGVTPGGTAGANIHIGSGGDWGGANFDGLIDMAAHWDRVLTDGEISAIYTAQLQDFTGTAFHSGSTHSSITLTNSDLTAEKTDENLFWRTALVGTHRSSGKYYFEYTYDTAGSDDNIMYGVAHHTPEQPLNNFIGSGSDGWGFQGGGASKWPGGGSWGSTVAAGDVVMCAVDLDNDEIYWGKNGTWFNSGDPSTNTNPAFTTVAGSIYPGLSMTATSQKVTINLGGSAFSYTVPSGYSAWES
ncbi:MAG: LamG-like jellyroll fold domain-containing protein [Saprospiraceae bacterium]|nr:LamG-like jellyroll fold domain-containing protein [Saprospiraceae bacterium]